jgi:hypothetical protein
VALAGLLLRAFRGFQGQADGSPRRRSSRQAGRALALVLVLTGSGALQAQSLLPQTDSLLHWVDALSGEKPVQVNGRSIRIASRAYRDSGNTQALLFLEAQLRRWGYALQRDSFSAGGVNLLAGHRLERQAYYIFCAHYDGATSGIGPAADDNASGVAAVLEAARLLRDSLPRQPIRFVFWDEEERGLLGSKAYAPKALDRGDTILGVLNLDMLGWEDFGPPYVEMHSFDLPGATVLEDALLQAYAGEFPQLERIKPGIRSSDHGPFWEQQVPALLLIEDFSDDFNPFYHSRNDKVFFFDTAYFAANSRAAYRALTELAGRPTLPTGAPGERRPGAGDGVDWLRLTAEGRLHLAPEAPPLQSLRYRWFDAMGRSLGGGVWSSLPSAGGSMTPAPRPEAPGLYLLRLEWQERTGRRHTATMKWHAS